MTDLAQLEHQKRDLLAPFETWSPARLSFRSAPDAWSAAEVLQHLVKTEREILAVARRNLGRPHAIGIRDRLGYRFIQRIFLSEKKVKVPRSAPKVLPDTNPHLPDVLAEWESTRDQLRLFHGRLSPEELRGGIFRHPVAGWMDLPQILGFFSVHMVHHGFQLARLTAATAEA